jgi:two-component system OmpR family sensor kinase/two-component system sensor histidine kinase BaeS
MRSLSVKLTGAFSLIILLGAAITYVVAGRTVASEFRLYVNQRGQLWATNWAPFFADYYARVGNWAGVEGLVSDLPIVGASGGDMGGGRGGLRRGQGESGAGSGLAGGYGSGGAAEDYLILADVDGHVVLDTQGQMVGHTLSPDELAQGAPVRADGERVGTLLVIAPESGPSAALADDFLTALNRGVLLAAVSAGLVALLVGAALVRQIIAPLRSLKAAAGAIASGDLSQRVAISSRDEVGDVGYAFNQMAIALERNEQLRRHMMADIAHELRTPLTIVQGQVEALLDGVFPLTREQLAPIHDETLLLSRLVTDLREVALAEAGQLTMARSPIDVGDLIHRVVAAVEPATAEKDIALSLDVAPNLPTVSADADRLSQVVHNLLSNALRHTPPGGRVVISVEIRPSEKRGKEIPIHPTSLPAFQPSSPSLLVSVTDTGPGIPPEDLPYIFDRFYRADKSRSRAEGGSGLGLTIARYIVEAHGGRIEAQSQAGEGTRIEFALPITSRESKSETSGEHLSPPLVIPES